MEVPPPRSAAGPTVCSRPRLPREQESPGNCGAERAAIETLCSLLYESPTPDANGDTWIMAADPGITTSADDEQVCPKA